MTRKQERDEAVRQAAAKRAAKAAEASKLSVPPKSTAKQVVKESKLEVSAEVAEEAEETEKEVEAINDDWSDSQGTRLKVGSWNQHRKSSYVQKDTPWTAAMIELGYSQSNDVDPAIEEVINLQYSPSEIRSWISEHDVTAIQEIDPLFSAVLTKELKEGLIKGKNDFDARGVEVDSTSALLLSPKAGLTVMKQQSATLKVTSRGKEASRDHVVALVEHDDGASIVLCSAHLHPPNMVESSGSKYTEYLKPLRDAVVSVAGMDAAGHLKVPCLIIGDFNIEPEDFKKRTSSDRFWNLFRAEVPEGGATAHSSNPCSRGDFGLAAGAAKWQGRAIGPSDFSGFEEHAKKVTDLLEEHLKLRTARQQFQAAAASCKEAQEFLSKLMKTQKSGEVQLSQLTHDKLGHAASKLEDLEHTLGEDTKKAKPAKLKRSLINSDHRPLLFQGLVPVGKTKTR